MAENMSEFKSILVERVKHLQRSSLEVKQQWYSYCRRHGTASFDPSRHDESYLQGFLRQFEGTLLPAGDEVSSAAEVAAAASVKDSPGKSALIQRVKDIQRSSPDNKKAWYTFCTNQCTTNYDPARHNETFLKKFVESFEEEAKASSAMDMWSAWGQMGGDDWWTALGSWGKGKGSSSSSSSAAVAAAAGGEGGDMSGWWSGAAASGGGGGGGEWGAAGAGEWDNWDPNMSAAWMCMMMKGKSMMMSSKGAGGKGVESTYGKAANGGLNVPQPRLPPNTLPTGQSMGPNGMSEFGILDKPLTQERLNQKRGAGAVSVETTGKVMTEEEARKFQESLKKRRTA